MRSAALLPLLLLAVVPSVPVAAQEIERYRLERTEDGFVRMDIRTGEMSICGERGEQLICRASVDERVAFESRIEELEAQIDGLTNRVSQLESRVVVNPEALLPSEEDFERTLDQMERFFRRFMGLARELDQEEADPRGQSHTPDRT